MRFFSDYDRLLREVDIFKITTFVFLITIIILVYKIIGISENTKYVITPPVVKSEFSVVGGKYDNSYFEQVGFFVSTCLLTVSPSTIDISFDSAMPYFTKEADHMKEIKNYLIEQADRIKEDDIYQTFYPLKVVVNNKEKVFTVEGMLKKLTGNTFVSSEKKSIDYHFDIGANSALEIKSFVMR